MPLLDHEGAVLRAGIRIALPESAADHGGVTAWLGTGLVAVAALAGLGLAWWLWRAWRLAYGGISLRRLGPAERATAGHGQAVELRRGGPVGVVYDVPLAIMYRVDRQSARLKTLALIAGLALLAVFASVLDDVALWQRLGLLLLIAVPLYWAAMPGEAGRLRDWLLIREIRRFQAGGAWRA